MKQVVIRADSSFEIGTGHIMRCLTLAKKLEKNAIQVMFLCKKHPGNINQYIQKLGFKLIELPLSEDTRPAQSKETLLSHSRWLGSSQLDDVKDCLKYLSTQKVDWLIVDHYALDKTWETAIKSAASKTMVIDDLADRHHDCDVLLDQNLGRVNLDYQELVGPECQLLLGTDFCLLRPEFEAFRSQSLANRQVKPIKSILLNMGGVDVENYTECVLRDLENFRWAEDPRIHVVMGGSSLNLEKVKLYIQKMSLPVMLHVATDNMAELMCQCDLAIGAAGSTSWERCCLGLPTIMLILAENQKVIANGLEDHQAAWVLPEYGSEKLQQFIQEMTPEALYQTSINSSMLVDGKGCDRVVVEMGLNE